MTKQRFALNDGTYPELIVIAQKSKSIPSVGIAYQISKVVDLDNVISVDKDGVKFGCRYIYEEIDLATDSVKYARYMGIDNIKRNYKWALED